MLIMIYGGILFKNIFLTLSDILTMIVKQQSVYLYIRFFGFYITYNIRYLSFCIECTEADYESVFRPTQCTFISTIL